MSVDQYVSVFVKFAPCRSYPVFEFSLASLLQVSRSMAAEVLVKVVFKQHFNHAACDVQKERRLKMRSREYFCFAGAQVQTSCGQFRAQHFHHAYQLLPCRGIDERVIGIILASFLGGLFTSESNFSSQVMARLLQDSRAHGFHGVPPFQLTELRRAMNRMKNRRCCDHDGVVLEMFKHGEVFNGMLASGRFEPSWSQTLFTMFSKQGNLADVGNWRPIAFLKITYKIFSRMLYHRVRGMLEYHQSADQVGFRSGLSVDHMFAVFDSISGKVLEWNIPLWMASLDLKKAFDRIEHGALFTALQSQGVGHSYQTWLVALYSQQSGSVNGSTPFVINRGVKQGDVISPLLFNAGLEMAIARWKLRLATHGVSLGPGERHRQKASINTGEARRKSDTMLNPHILTRPS